MTRAPQGSRLVRRTLRTPITTRVLLLSATASVLIGAVMVVLIVAVTGQRDAGPLGVPLAGGDHGRQRAREVADQPRERPARLRRERPRAARSSRANRPCTSYPGAGPPPELASSPTSPRQQAPVAADHRPRSTTTCTLWAHAAARRSPASARAARRRDRHRHAAASGSTRIRASFASAVRAGARRRRRRASTAPRAARTAPIGVGIGGLACVLLARRRRSRSSCAARSCARS